MGNLQHSTGTEAPIGVLIMAYGTPSSPDQVEAYYTHIRHGHAPTPALLAELRGRYQAIGGVSPLFEYTQQQLNGIQSALDAAEPGRYRCILGMKHTHPFIEESVRELVAGGVRQIIGLVLAPHYSSMSVGEYQERAQEAIPAGTDVQFAAIKQWHLEPAYLDFLRGQVESVKQQLEAEHGLSDDDVEVLFTAHSLPTRILEHGDPYPAQLKETATAVAGQAQLTHWSIAWQSAGRTNEPWIGPSVSQVIPELIKRGRKGFIVCPAGFVSDHLEVLYDLDIETAAQAREQKIAFARTAVPNADPAVMTMLAHLIQEEQRKLQLSHV